MTDLGWDYLTFGHGIAARHQQYSVALIALQHSLEPHFKGELCRTDHAVSLIFMAERGVLRVQPDVMHDASQALSDAAKDLQARLFELDGHVRELLSGWHGGSGNAYGQAWELWHRGTGEVQLGLSILAKAVGVAGVDFQNHDHTSTQTVDGIYRG